MMYIVDGVIRSRASTKSLKTGCAVFNRFLLGNVKEIRTQSIQVRSAFHLHFVSVIIRYLLKVTKLPLHAFKAKSNWHRIQNRMFLCLQKNDYP